jgi:hypothetical protein
VAQCPSGSCAVPARGSQPMWQALYEDGWHYLVLDGYYLLGVSPGQVSVWYRGQWHTVALPDGCWCGASCACGHQSRGAASANYGVDQTKISPWPQYTRCGRTIRRDEAMAAASLPQDTMLPYLTVIGGAAQDRQRILADMAKWDETKNFRVHDWPADSPMVTQAGFVAHPDKVTIYFQDAMGKVLARIDGDPGPEGLRKVMQYMISKIRQADPHYDPAKDPNPLLWHAGEHTVWWEALYWAPLLLLLTYAVLNWLQYWKQCRTPTSR